MTATEELRRLLDERGADYRVSATGYSIDIGTYTTAYANRSDTTLDVSLRQVTPEQAIAATLGPAYEPPMAMHWNGDVLTLTIPRDPSCIRVQRSAEQPCKVYADESKVIAATLGNDGVGRTNDGLADLQAENAKLRELVQRMHGHIKESCDECDGWYCSNFDEDNECCVYDTLARELGVEVDE